MKTKKIAILLLSAAITVSSLVGCTKTQPTNTDGTKKPEETKQKVVFWGGQFGSNKIFDRFKEETGIDYEYPVNFVDNAKLVAAIASGAPPDAAFVYMSDVPKLAAANAIRPIDDYIKDGSIKWDDYYDWAVGLGMYNGKHYALNWDISTQVLYYNKKMFEQAGLDPNKPPKTWQELYDFSKKLTKFDSKGNLVQRGYQAEWWKAGVLTFQEEAITPGWKPADPYTVNLNSPIRTEAWELVKSLYQLQGGEEAVKKAQDAGVKFGLEFDTTAMKIDDIQWPYQIYTEQYPDMDFGIAPVPSKAGAKNAMAMDATWALVLPAKSKNPELGLAIAKWLATSGLFAGEKKALEADPSAYWTMPLANKKYTETIIKEYLPQVTNEKLKNRELYKFDLITKIAVPVTKSPVDFGKAEDEAWQKFYKGEVSAKEAIASVEEKNKKAVENFIKEKKAMGVWQENQTK